MKDFQYRGVKVVLSRVFTAALLAVFILFILPMLASAAETRVVINEIMWDGAEYVELYNATDEDINIGGWALTRQQAGGEVKEIVRFDETEAIEAGGYWLVDKNDKATEIEADKMASKLTLVNTGEQVVLLDAEGGVVDRANRLGLWWAGENTEGKDDAREGVAMERVSGDVAGEAENSWYSSTGDSGGRQGTPGLVNSEPYINTAPEAEAAGPSEGLVGEELIFTAEDSSDGDGDILTYAWSFGDGGAAAGADAAHEYQAAGDYAVKVTVSDGELEDEALLEVKIEAPVYSDDVVVNEFLPNPAGSDSEGEFIELKNTGGTAVDLSSWQLDDAEGGSSRYTIDAGEVIEAGGILSFDRLEVKIALNNGGDDVRLLDPAGEVRSSYSYESSEEGYSYARDDGGSYVVSTTPTPGEENVITEPIEEEGEEGSEGSSEGIVAEEGKVAGASVKKVELKEVRYEEKGTKVEVEGVVSVPPGVFGEKYVYLSGSGIQVYFNKEEWPDMQLGDRVSLVGELSSVQGEARLKLARALDIEVLESGDPPSPHLVKTGEVGEELEGSLVVMQGRVSRTSGNVFYVNDGSGEVKVYIKPATEIDKPKMKKGVAVTVTGVVSQTSSGYRVLPRFQEDVRLGLVAGMTSFPATGNHYGWLVGVALVGYQLVGAWRSREPAMRKFSGLVNN